MSAYVFDASAVLATLLEEHGAAEVEARLRGAAISAVNLSEVIAKLAERGMPEDAICAVVAAIDLDVRPFDEAQALRSGLLRRSTRAFGLSFGDRACLSLAQELARPVLTTDKAWSRIDIGVTIELAR